MENLSLFDCNKMPLKIDKPIRLIELFAGIGSQAKALKRLGADFEHYRVCEFDKYAVKSYNAIHGTDFVTSDVTQITAEDLGIVDTNKYCYILTYSFPCQDLSLAGKGNGMAKGSGTRSGLLWEVERLLSECSELPQILLMENVTQVHGKKNKEHFDEWIRFLESKGYSNYWKDLNAKNFGIPQNRNRTFMVSVLGNYTYEFPEEFPLELRLKDMLEDTVDEKFYLSEKMINFFQENTKKQQEKGNGFKFQPTDGTGCDSFPTTRAGGRMDDNFIEEPIRLGGLFDTEQITHQEGSIWDKNALAPTIDTMQGGYRQPLVVDPFIVRSVGRNPDKPTDRTPGIPTKQRLETNLSGCSNTLTTVQKDNYVAEPLAYDEQNGCIRKDGTVGTLTTDGSSPKHNNRVIENCYVSEKGVKYILDAKQGMATDVNADVCQPLTAKGQANWTGSFVSPDIESLEKSSTIGNKEPTKINLKDGTQITSNDNLSGLRIRKLTPRETWRLMGFDDTDFEKASAVNSNSQLYKQAGNSIVVDVLCYIFGRML